MNNWKELEELIKDDADAREELLRIIGTSRVKSQSRKTVFTESAVSSRDNIVVPIEFRIPPIPSDFYELIPGTNLWMLYWREHSTQQDKMLAYAKERRALK